MRSPSSWEQTETSKWYNAARIVCLGKRQSELLLRIQVRSAPRGGPKRAWNVI